MFSCLFDALRRYAMMRAMRACAMFARTLRRQMRHDTFDERRHVDIYLRHACRRAACLLPPPCQQHAPLRRRRHASHACHAFRHVADAVAYFHDDTLSR